MTYRTEIDVAHDAPISEFLTFLKLHDARIYDFQAEGPAGGNPLFVLDFDNYQSIVDFLQVWFLDNDQDYINSHIMIVDEGV